jgi:small subunit ribosomal protein S6
MPLLRDYEILYIVRPELDDEQLAGAVRSVDTLIANLGGTVQKTDVWGRRRLAYEVRRLREGHYVLTDFRLDTARLPEMEATLRISDSVFRHLITRKPEPRRRPAALEAQQAEGSAAEPEPVAAAAAAGSENEEAESAEGAEG